MLEAAAETILSKHIKPIHKNFKTVLEHIQEEKSSQKKENNYALVRGGEYYLVHIKAPPFRATAK